MLVAMAISRNRYDGFPVAIVSVRDLDVRIIVGGWNDTDAVNPTTTAT